MASSQKENFKCSNPYAPLSKQRRCPSEDQLKGIKKIIPVRARVKPDERAKLLFTPPPSPKHAQKSSPVKLEKPTFKLELGSATGRPPLTDLFPNTCEHESADSMVKNLLRMRERMDSTPAFASQTMNQNDLCAVSALISLKAAAKSNYSISGSPTSSPKVKLEHPIHKIKSDRWSPYPTPDYASLWPSPPKPVKKRRTIAKPRPAHRPPPLERATEHGVIFPTKGYVPVAIDRRRKYERDPEWKP